MCMVMLNLFQWHVENYLLQCICYSLWLPSTSFTQWSWLLVGNQHTICHIISCKTTEYRSISNLLVEYLPTNSWKEKGKNNQWNHIWENLPSLYFIPTKARSRTLEIIEMARISWVFWVKTLQLRKSESWLENIQRKDNIHDKLHWQWRYTIRTGEKNNQKATKSKHLGQLLTSKTLQKKSLPKLEQHGTVLEKKRETFQDKQLRISLKKQVMDQYVLPTMTNGCQTWNLTKNWPRIAQRTMERKVLKQQDNVPCSQIRKIMTITDIEYILKQKWKWTGHMARMRDNRWTKRWTEWQPRKEKRSTGRPDRRLQDDIVKEAATWKGQQ